MKMDPLISVIIPSFNRAAMLREAVDSVLAQTWRDKDAATDVLSFPMNAVDPDGRRHIGDIALCLDIAREQVAGSRDAIPRQAARLALHGLLHLLGYDHETDEGEMNALERELRKSALGEAS